MKLKSAFGAIFALILACQQAFGAATLLPNGEQCFQATTGINGMVGLLGTVTGGTGGTTGTYGGVVLTGGSGSGATANITVAGGTVTAVVILNPGTQYVVGDVLSAAAANIGNVTGFSVPVSSVSINSSLAGGSVAFYQPNTQTLKSTWFNADQAAIHQNTNPVTLDANGCAIIYGIGSYRQVLKDSLGNTVWDQITTDTSANNSTFWAGLAAGTPNAITVTDPGFNGTDGSIIQFIPVSSNTGPATLNPSGFGAISIVKDTTTGAVALSGGEIVANSPSNVINVVYSASQANFHILNLVSPTAAQSPQTICGALGLKIANDGTTPNTKITITADQITMVANGQTISRLNVSLSLNLTVNGANGLDTGSYNVANEILNLYVIDNGSAAASLASLSATAPTMPSGYSYKCRLGAAMSDSSPNLYRFKQFGNRTRYFPSAGNTVSYPFINNGPVGSNCGTNSPTPFIQDLSAFIPPTATFANLIMMNQYNGNAAANVLVMSTFSSSGSLGGTSPPVVGTTATAAQVVNIDIVLNTPQTTNWCASGSGGALFAAGWQDKVNAN